MELLTPTGLRPAMGLRKPTLRLGLGAAVLGLTSVALVPSGSFASASTTNARAGSATTVASPFNTDLKGICPSTIVVQTNWWPEPDHGFLYELIGANGTINSQNDTYTGPLGSTGVNLEIKAGGPAVGYQTVTSQLYVNNSILLGLVGTDEAIENSAHQPTVAVFGEYEKNPTVFFWGNPSWSFSSVAAIGKSKDTVLLYSGETMTDVFLGKGWFNQAQLNTSYDGGPAQFVAANGNVISQGFATYEPYFYEHELKQWDKPVKVLLVGNSYPTYENALAARPSVLTQYHACLTKLVPLFQKALIDYVNNPTTVDQVLVKFINALDAKGFVLTDASGAAAVQVMKADGIVSNGPDGVIGSFQTSRVQGLINQLSPIFAKQGKAVKVGLVPSDIATNEFLEPSLHL
jgi:hypothetical protein